MDAQNLSRDLDTLAACSGCTLNIEERSFLGPSLRVLAEEGKFARVQLWGKVQGQSGDYVIAQGIGFPDNDETQRSKVAGAEPVLVEFFDSVNDVPKKNFRLGPDGVSWVPLVEVTDEVRVKINDHDAHCRKNGQIFAPLTGNPANKFAYQVVIPPPPSEPKPEGEEGEGGEEEEPAGPTIEDREVSEEDRLACLVADIDHACSVVPRGSHILDSSRRISRNGYFNGVPVNDATSLNQYQHCRKPTASQQSSVESRSSLDASYDFADSLSLDAPKGCWSVVHDPVSCATAIRSLLYPGYCAFHVAGTPAYGALYVGNGQKNVDLAFML